jgi:hypothetical protein
VEVADLAVTHQKTLSRLSGRLSVMGVPDVCDEKIKGAELENARSKVRSSKRAARAATTLDLSQEERRFIN